MQASEKLFLQSVGRYVAGRFKTWTAPIVERIEKIETVMRAPPVTLTAEQAEAVRGIVDNAVGEILLTRMDELEAAIAAIPAGPPGKDGKDGVDGADGKSISADDIDSLVVATVHDAIAALPAGVHVVSGYVDRAGDLYFTNSDGSVFEAGHVVGADADPAKIAETIKAEFAKIPPPKDGKDGFGLADFTMQFDGRTLTLGFADASGITKEHKIKTAGPLYQGVWRDGTYQAGDSATHEGSTWIALKDTDTRPGTPNSDWQLAVKRGRDGKEGKQGPAGEAGKAGRDGRDLTQLGPDGSKW